MSYRWYTERHDPVINVHGAFSAIADLSLSLGVLEQQLFRSLRVDFHELIQPDSKCSAEQLMQLIYNIQSLSIKLPEMPFRSALMARDRMPFPIKELMALCDSSDEKIDYLFKFQQQINPLVRLEHFSDHENLYILICDRYGFGRQASFVMDYSAALLLSLLRGGALPTPQVTVSFSSQEPRDVANHFQYLTDRITFSSPLNVITVPWDSKQKEAKTRSSINKQRCLLECEQFYQNSRVSRSFLDECAGYIDEGLGQKNINLKGCADRFYKSVSTVKRKFSFHQTSFQSIMDERVVLYALEKLYNGCSATEIAQVLQYSNAANFRRTFKRCTNKWPKHSQDGLFYVLKNG